MIRLTSYFNKIHINKFLGIDGSLPFSITERLLETPFGNMFQQFCSRVFLHRLTTKSPKIISYLRTLQKPQEPNTLKIYKINTPDLLEVGKLDHMLLDTYILEYNNLNCNSPLLGILK